MGQRVSSLELASEYLKSIGVPRGTVDRKLYYCQFEPLVYRVKLKKSNIVRKNKCGLKSKETHIHIWKNFREIFFSQEEINDYENTGNTHQTEQNFDFFEANIYKMLERRVLTQERSSVLSDASPKGIYSVSGEILPGIGCKWIDSNDGETQLRLSKASIDSDSFSDFRLGIQVEDTLIMAKNKFTGRMLAVSVPAEFAQKYEVVSMSVAGREQRERRNELREDNEYINEVEECSEIMVPRTPQPPVKAAPGKTGAVYKAKAGIGRRALRDSGYVCECGPMHHTFIARSTGNPYMEPHHLIPISKQGLFEYGLDVPANIVCLCPTCHSCIHYGTKEEMKSMLKSLFEKRAEKLEAYGIGVTEAELFALYQL